MQTVDIERDVRSFVVQHFLSGDAGKLGPDGWLVDEVIDSMGVVALVAFLQEHFEITVEDDEVIPSNFDNINHVVAYVERKLGA